MGMRCLRLLKSACGAVIKLYRQAVLAVVLHDPTLLASLADGQLSGAFGTFGSIHDLLAQLVIASLLPQACQSLCHVRFFHLAPCDWSSGLRLAARRKPESLRIQ